MPKRMGLSFSRFPNKTKPKEIIIFWSKSFFFFQVLEKKISFVFFGQLNGWQDHSLMMMLKICVLGDVLKRFVAVLRYYFSSLNGFFVWAAVHLCQLFLNSSPLEKRKNFTLSPLSLSFSLSLSLYLYLSPFLFISLSLSLNLSLFLSLSLSLSISLSLSRSLEIKFVIQQSKGYQLILQKFSFK